MTAPLSFRRDATDVQAMRLDDRVSTYAAAQGWLNDHGVRSAINWDFDLVIYGPGSRMVARLGDWLTLDERTATFAVVPDSEFRKEHREREAS